jgi:hypothetical protein
LDGWLGKRFASHRIASHRIASHRIASHRIASHRIEETVRAMVSSQDASPTCGPDAISADAARRLAECDT